MGCGNTQCRSRYCRFAVVGSFLMARKEVTSPSYSSEPLVVAPTPSATATVVLPSPLQSDLMPLRRKGRVQRERMWDGVVRHPSSSVPVPPPQPEVVPEAHVLLTLASLQYWSSGKAESSWHCSSIQLEKHIGHVMYTGPNNMLAIFLAAGQRLNSLIHLHCKTALWFDSLVGLQWHNSECLMPKLYSCHSYTVVPIKDITK